MQEYERAVIFRLGRLLPGGAKGPGMEVSVVKCNKIFWRDDTPYLGDCCIKVTV